MRFVLRFVAQFEFDSEIIDRESKTYILQIVAHAIYS